MKTGSADSVFTFEIKVILLSHAQVGAVLTEALVVFLRFLERSY